MALIIGLESRVIGRADRASSFSLENVQPFLGGSAVKRRPDSFVQSVISYKYEYFKHGSKRAEIVRLS